MSRTSRVVAVMYNPYLRWLYEWADRLGLRHGEPPSTFVTSVDLANISKLAGFEVVRERPVAFLPWLDLIHIRRCRRITNVEFSMTGDTLKKKCDRNEVDTYVYGKEL